MTQTTIILLCLITFFHCSVAYPNPTFNNPELDDLGGPDGSFDEEAKDWNAVGLLGTNKTTKCNGFSMLGGPGVLSTNGYFEKNITSLPSHDTIYFRVHIFLIDDWQQPDTVILQFDGKNFSAGDISMSKSNFPADFCGDPSFPDLESFYMVGQVGHSLDNVTIRVISEMSQPSTIASFGVGRVNLIFENSANRGGNLSETSCNKADVTILSNACTCPPGKYEDPNNLGSCLVCDGDCVDCFGSGSSKCYTCTAGYSYLNNKCMRCHISCSTCSGHGASSCTRCDTNRWYNWDSSCENTCRSPAYAQEIQGDIQICKPPCLTNQFYDWNTSCGDDCPSPLVSSANAYGNFCNLPCSASQFLYWNNTCSAKCPYPLQNSTFQNAVNLCQKPCSTGEYYYSDGRCLTNCSLPLITSVQNEVQVCNSPCKLNEYYYELNSSCLSACNSPNYVESASFFNKCILVNTTTETKQEIFEPTQTLREITAVSDAGGQAISITTAIAAFIGASNPASATLAGFVKMLPYIRYIKINYPPKLQYMLDNMNSSLVSFALGPAITEDQQNAFSKYSVPANFDKYDFHSSFLVNYWQTFMSLLIILGAILFLSIIAHYLKKRKGIYNILEGLKLILKWNFFLMIFCTNLDSIVLGTSLQMRAMHIDSFQSAISILICFIMNIFTFFILGLIFYIIKDIRRKRNSIHPNKSSSSQPINPETRWKDFQLFFKGSKDEKFITHIFMLPYLLRICSFNFIISYFFEYPLAQAILITLLSVFLLAYMLWKRPFVSNLVFCQHTTDELTMLLVNLSMLSLAVLDHREVDDDDTRELFGNIIIYSNIVFNMTANIYLVAYLAVGFKAAYDNTKKHKKKGLLSWLIAFLAPFEAGGMDLEIVPQNDEKTPRPPSPKSYLMETESQRHDLRNRQGNEGQESFMSNSFNKEQNEVGAASLFIQDKNKFNSTSRLSYQSFSPLESPKLENVNLLERPMSSVPIRSSAFLPKANQLQEGESTPTDNKRHNTNSLRVNNLMVDDSKQSLEVKKTGSETSSVPQDLEQSNLKIEKNLSEGEKVNIDQNVSKDDEKDMVQVEDLEDK